MIDVKNAANAATSYLKDIYGTADIGDLMLEEVELSENEQHWLITIGLSRPKLQKSLIQEVLNSGERERIYKVIKVRAMDGKPLSMKIREV